MKAIVQEGSGSEDVLQVREIDKPVVTDDGVLVRVRACGICGGDLKPYRYHDGPFPRFMGGHEYAGEVVEVGARVEQFRPGDAVVRCFGNVCGLCPNCLVGSPNFCTGVERPTDPGGGFAEFVATSTPPRGCGLFPTPAGLSFEALVRRVLEQALARAPVVSRSPRP